MKENGRHVSEKQDDMSLNSLNLKNNNEVVNMWLVKSIEHLHHQIFFCVCIYKMVDSSAETWNNAGVSVIRMHENDDAYKGLLLLLCISDISKRCRYRNIYDLIDKEIKGKQKVKKMNELTKQQIRKYKINRARLIKCSKQSMYINKVIAIPTVMQTT